MTVSVLGLGYVGMTLSLRLADMGEEVIGIDCNQRLVENLLRGKLHVSEPGLQELLDLHLGKRFLPTNETKELTSASTHILCVNTPVDAQGEPDMTTLVQAAGSVGEHMAEGNLVVVRSTVPPGKTRSVVLPALESGSGLKVGTDFLLCVAPERTVEGRALSELENLPQIIGGFNHESTEAGSAFFSQITDKIKIVSSMEAAEMAKLMDNSYRYAIFAIGNEFGLACEAMGLDAYEVIEAANWEYPRNDIKMPGAGVGGGCLPKDTKILVNTMEKSGARPILFTAAQEVNDGMPHHVFKVIDHFHLSQKIAKHRSKILILGFAFKGKPEVNDTRHSPGGFLSRLLAEAGYRVYGYDPVVGKDRLREFGAEPCDPEEGFDGATTVVTMNDNPRFSTLDLFKLSRKMSNPSMILDGWRVLDGSELEGTEVLFSRVGNGRTREFPK